ncbi:U-box domain-containing protein 34-like isoform X2 [Rhododendron vialii]|uniref:U-box domain-containing protein 34-like isoform X2 n=1 Tax=Rhododendron vialii TaxID=182163 RepID=UPI00265E2D82|nr:U-box domain-containing protein 34-like isoform X2 [Rhododendron vialii]
MDKATRFVLVHVVPTINSIPTPSGDAIPIEQVDAHTVNMYMQDQKRACQEIFVPFKKLCRRKKIETAVLECDNTASALLQYVSASGISSLVLGIRTTNFIPRKIKDSTVPRAVLKNAPETCKIYVVSKGKLLNNPGSSLSTGESSSRGGSSTHRERSSLRNSDLGSSIYAFSAVSSESDLSHLNSMAIGQLTHPNHSGSPPEINHQSLGNSILEIDSVNECRSVASTETKQSDLQADAEELGLELNSGRYSSTVDHEVNDTVTSSSDLSYLNSKATAEKRYPNHISSLQERNHRNSGNTILGVEQEDECPSMAETETHAEVEQLRKELMNTVGLYNRAFEDFVHAQNEVHFLSSECLEEERQVNAALRREEVYKKIAADEKRKHLEAMKEIEEASKLLAKEAYEKKIAERKAAQESLEKKKIMDALLSNDRRYKRYTRDEIEKATDSFSEARLIGEGSYGKVYRCFLDKTPVAVKVLHCSDASEKKKEFLTEIEVLCKLRHPHIVLLLGACPEIGCLVFEYMENGSLEDFLSEKSSKHPLPWFVRFRIAFEVACGLAFLHNTKPDPIIHRDLKPGNIFLDRNYVSKIGDVGLAKLVSNVAPDNITAYSDSIIFGSLYYVDPEYHRTGTVRPKSDLYAFGIIVLQLLAAQHPDGLLLKFEAALSNGLLSDILDKSILDWPPAEVEELAHMALKCSRLRCRDRPDLENEVLPLLKRLADMADDTSRVQRNSIHPPNHYFCPILQVVMEDPYIAADGFTYERREIKAWLKKHSSSPVTKVRLKHKVLIQNHTLRSAIEDWRSQAASSSG